MKNEHETLAELSAQYHKFKFHRTVLLLCVLYFGYSYSTDFLQGSVGYRIFMGTILTGIVALTLYAHMKLGQLQKKIHTEQKKDDEQQN